MSKRMTYDELVNLCCQVVLEELMKGSFRDGVVRSIHYILNWYEQAEKKG